MPLRVDGDSITAFLSFVMFYAGGYIFVFRHDILRRIEKTHHPSISPIGRKKGGISYGPLFVISGLVGLLLSFTQLHFFLVDVSQGKCGVFINIPTALAVVIFTIAGTVSLFNPEKMLRLYVYANTWISKHIMKVSSPPPIPEEVYKRQLLNIRITGAAWLVVALAGSCILY